jgi:hypothetical protein
MATESAEKTDLLLRSSPPSPDRDNRPNSLDQAEWPCPLQKPIDRSQHAGPGKSEHKPPTALLECVAHYHGRYREESKCSKTIHAVLSSAVLRGDRISTEP